MPYILARGRWLPILGLAAMLAMPSGAQAQLRQGGRIAVTAEEFFSYAPAVAVNPASGDAVAVWSESRTNTDNLSINRVRGRAISAEGGAAGNIALISSKAQDNSALGGSNPQIVYNAKQNQFFTVYERSYAVAQKPGIYGQRLNANGAPIGEEIQIFQAAGRAHPVLAFDAANNRYLAAWSNGQGGIEGQFVKGSGDLSGNLLNFSTAGLRMDNPSLAYNPAAKAYLLAFDAFSKTVSDLYGQIVKEDGRLSGQAFIISDAANRQAEPLALYGSKAGQFAVFWSDSRDLSNSGLNVYAQLVDGDGKLAGENQRLASRALAPRAVYAPGENLYLLCWIVQNPDDPYDAYLYGRYLSAELGGMGRKFKISTGDKVQAPPALGIDASTSRALAVWPYLPDPTQANAIQQIHGQWLDLTVRLTDMALSMKAKPNHVEVGGSVAFNILIENQGPAVAQQAQWTGTLAQGIDLQSVNTSQGECLPPDGMGMLTCRLDNIGVGKTVKIDLAASVSQLGLLDNASSLAWFNNESDASALTANAPVKSVYPGSLQILEPNGGEVLPAGDLAQIRWALIGESPPLNLSYKLEYSLDNGGHWKPVSSDLLTGESYEWMVPVPTKNSNKCLLRITAYAQDQVAAKDRADSVFSIEVLRLTAPNGGETLNAGQVYPITWITQATARHVDATVLKYSLNGGAAWRKIDTLDGDPQAYQWTVPALDKPTAKGKIRVEWYDAQGRSLGADVSDGVFAVTP
jgi:hypothetical protein